MAELTLEEARKIYSESDSLKDLMLTKFTKAELEKHEVTQAEFDKKFIELLGQCTKTVFLNANGLISDLPTNRIELRNKDNEWLFDICFTGNEKHFWVNSYRVWNILANEFHLQDDDIQLLTKNQMKKLFGLDEKIIT
jgi:hypothetical protein